MLFIGAKHICHAYNYKRRIVVTHMTTVPDRLELYSLSHYAKLQLDQTYLDRVSANSFICLVNNIIDIKITHGAFRAVFKTRLAVVLQLTFLQKIFRASVYKYIKDNELFDLCFPLKYRRQCNALEPKYSREVDIFQLFQSLTLD